ncbi:hypothetical protein BX070DRAFT_64601 [Coemansia spiralis]|nr:hypothetical protein BX070DRAFT_64601 [Coemansia spiralis]
MHRKSFAVTWNMRAYFSLLTVGIGSTGCVISPNANLKRRLLRGRSAQMQTMRENALARNTRICGDVVLVCQANCIVSSQVCLHGFKHAHIHIHIHIHEPMLLKTFSSVPIIQPSFFIWQMNSTRVGWQLLPIVRRLSWVLNADAFADTLAAADPDWRLYFYNIYIYIYMSCTMVSCNSRYVPFSYACPRLWASADFLFSFLFQSSSTFSTLLPCCHMLCAWLYSTKQKRSGIMQPPIMKIQKL